MYSIKLIKTLALLFLSLSLFIPVSFAGANRSNTDTVDSLLFYFFDLRERETFIQLTNTDLTPPMPPPGLMTSVDTTVHVQIFNVSNDCNENDFFDVYTPNDTHIYNMRDIQTNDGNPSGVILPDGAYGIVSIAVVNALGELNPGNSLFTGNLRIIDVTGYEYRTNALGVFNSRDTELVHLTFNFNTLEGVSFSDIVGIPFASNFSEGEVLVADITEHYFPADIDIFDENEVVFSCRNVIFACTDQDHHLLEELLEEADAASVASFEYGINNAIPHSKNGELLCPGNIINEGFVNMDIIDSNAAISTFVGFVGLNNGNGRGTIDSIWYNPGLGVW